MRTGPIGLAAIAAALVIPASATAQDAPAVERRENVQYYIAEYFDFKPGMEDQALDFAEAHFGPVSDPANPEIVFLPLTGQWDAIVFFPLAEGPDALAYEISPSDSEWFTRFAEREGGMEAAMGRLGEFNAMVARSHRELVMRPPQ